MVPQYRAAVLKGHLATLPTLGPDAMAAARAAAGAEQIRLIERTPGTEWLPSRTASDMVAAVAAAAGLDAVRRFGRGVGQRGLDGPIFSPLLTVARGMFGRLALVRSVPQAWQLGTRSAGALAVAAHGNDWAHLDHLDVPEELRSVEQLTGVAGVIEGGLLVCGATGAQVTLGYEPGAARARYELRWR